MNGSPQPAAPAPLNLNMNPVSNPTHPAHDVAAKHFGAMVGHLLTGNGEHAAHHLGQALGHMIAPHMPEETGRRVTQSMRQAAHKKKPKKRAKR